MKTIHQLVKAAKRIPKIARQSARKLEDTRPGHVLTEAGRRFYQSRLAGCAQAAILLRQEMKNRRIGMPGIRCALPMKQQRAILAANESAAAQKLLSGQSLAKAA